MKLYERIRLFVYSVFALVCGIFGIIETFKKYEDDDID